MSYIKTFNFLAGYHRQKILLDGDIPLRGYTYVWTVYESVAVDFQLVKSV
ncbi:hypothetical protein [Paenibacillus sp. N3.4]|nr:hypothetical protein [Paenibacillus sp. N3.4]